jgi:hypothetical protein
MKEKKPAPWTGIDWSVSTHRPGCQDFLKHPSRVGDKLIPHRTPILNNSKKVKS